MLTQEERQHILNEETYRQEVRLQIEKKAAPKSYKAKIWAVLNSSFGLWLLSTVAVGLITWSYTQWSQSRTEESVKNELIRKLDVEIVSRLQNFENVLNNASKIDDYERAMWVLGSSDGGNPGIIFPDFKDRNTRGLLWELLQLVPNEEKANVRKALEDLQKLMKLERFRKPKQSKDDPLTPDLQKNIVFANKVLQDLFNQPRWKMLRY